MRRGMALLLPLLLLLAGCSDGSYQEEERFTLAESPAVTFSDGASVDRWQNDRGDSLYKLPDGTELLRESPPAGPENVHVIGQESFDRLSRTAQAAISAYYEAQGRLYEVEAQLERAYQTYLRCRESGEEYSCAFLEQSTSISASNDRIVCCCTNWSLPAEEPGVSNPFSQGAVFDKKTGERISNWDLFAVSEEEVMDWFLEEMNLQDPVLEGEIRTAMRPEYLQVGQDSLTLSFPAGTLPSQAYAWGWGFPYDRSLRGILHPWAVPEAA